MHKTVATPGELAPRFELALAAAKSAAALALAAFQGQDLRVETKADRSVVTDADRDAERAIRARIERAFPDDGIEGEEYGVKAGRNGWIWHLDPIDGTQAFVRGVPLFGTLIGVECDGLVEIGVICLPALGEMVYAARGQGCHWWQGLHPDSHGGLVSTLEPRRAMVSKVANLGDALFCTTWMQSYRDTGRTALYGDLCRATGVARGWGDCYGYALVATGRAEVMVDPQLCAWDAAPMPVILEEAGGRYTTFAGQPDLRGGTGVASNGHLHDAVLRVINDAVG